MSKYYVVEFEGDGNIEAVPSNWITEWNETDTPTSTMWPKESMDSRKLINMISHRRQLPPGTYEIWNINKCHGDAVEYEEAVSILEIAMNESDVEGAIESLNNKSKRHERHAKSYDDYVTKIQVKKEKHTKPPRNNGKRNIPAPPAEKAAVPRKVPRNHLTLTEESITDASELFNGGEDVPATSTPRNSTSIEPIIIVQVPSVGSEDSTTHVNVEVAADMTDSLPTLNNELGVDEAINNNLGKSKPVIRADQRMNDSNVMALDKSSQELYAVVGNQKVLSNQSEMLRRLAFLEKKLDARQNMAPIADQRMTAINSMRNRLPFKNVPEFERYSEVNMSNPEEEELMKAYLRTLSRGDAHAVVKAIMTVLMADELAVRYNMDGRNRNVPENADENTLKRSFLKLKMYSTIVDLVKEICTATEDEVKKLTGNYLKQAPKRFKGAQNKRSVSAIRQ